MKRTVKYIDLFAGLGGIRLGFDQALEGCGLLGECVFTSEIKPHAVKVYTKNFSHETVHGDITQINPADIPDFDVLLAGFPCQPFSSAGSRKGFLDTRGTLFFTIEQILQTKKPKTFFLENVEGLVTHDRVDRANPIGRTLETILAHLGDLGYHVSWKLLDASEHGVPQRRKRIYIVGSLDETINLSEMEKTRSCLGDILEKKVNKNLYMDNLLTKKLLQHFDKKELVGKQIKDKRGGKNNIHSWDIELKGEVSREQKILLELILRQRRRRDWAERKCISWSDGMPLTLSDVASFALGRVDMIGKSLEQLKNLLEDLVKKGYLAFETPKQAQDREDLRGYNIVAGKLSFAISNILDPQDRAPTLVAMDVTKMAVLDELGFRRLTTREGLRLFGFPETYDISAVSYEEAFDLLGNSVSVNAIRLVGERLVKAAFLDTVVHSSFELHETTTRPQSFAFHTQQASA